MSREITVNTAYRQSDLTALVLINYVQYPLGRIFDNYRFDGAEILPSKPELVIDPEKSPSVKCFPEQ